MERAPAVVVLAAGSSSEAVGGLLVGGLGMNLWFGSVGMAAELVGTVQLERVVGIAAGAAGDISQGKQEASLRLAGVLGRCAWVLFFCCLLL